MQLRACRGLGGACFVGRLGHKALESPEPGLAQTMMLGDLHVADLPRRLRRHSCDGRPVTRRERSLHLG
jgi:hypothetical protein